MSKERSPRVHTVAAKYFENEETTNSALTSSEKETKRKSVPTKNIYIDKLEKIKSS